MKKLYFSTAAIALFLAGYLVSRPASNELPVFQRLELSDVFYAEGAGIGDLNNDGISDIIAGPYWYAGPDFRVRHEFYSPREFDPLEYSDNFVVHVVDFNGNDWNDILVVGFPGQEAYWYENPQGAEGHWNRHLVFATVENESPAFGDMTGDGRPELVFHHEGYVGYAAADWDDPTKPWIFHRVSTRGDRHQFTHGFGIGDITGNGHLDIMKKSGWWENPGPEGRDTLWNFHPADFGEGGAQMHAYDVDGDGYNDVVTSLDAHGWGLAWFRQVRQNGEIRFEKNLIMGDRPEDNPYGVAFSQPHAVALADIDGDGLMDIVTGKRFWAHGPTGDPEPNAPAVIYWFQLVRSEDGSVSYVPHLIDDDSGIGTYLDVGDLTGNGRPDMVVSNKKGTFVFRQSEERVSQAE